MAKQAITKEEVIARLDALTDDDAEVAHKESDMLLCDALLLVRMDDVVTAYLSARRRVGFMYS